MFSNKYLQLVVNDRSKRKDIVLNALRQNKKETKYSL